MESNFKRNLFRKLEVRSFVRVNCIRIIICFRWSYFDVYFIFQILFDIVDFSEKWIWARIRVMRILYSVLELVACWTAEYQVLRLSNPSCAFCKSKQKNENLLILEKSWKVFRIMIFRILIQFVKPSKIRIYHPIHEKWSTIGRCFRNSWKGSQRLMFVNLWRNSQIPSQ